MEAVHDGWLWSFQLVETAGINHGKSLATSSGIISMPTTSPFQAGLPTLWSACRQAGEKLDKYCWTHGFRRFASFSGLLKRGEIGQWAIVPEIHRANKHQQLL